MLILWYVKLFKLCLWKKNTWNGKQSFCNLPFELDCLPNFKSRNKKCVGRVHRISWKYNDLKTLKCCHAYKSYYCKTFVRSKSLDYSEVSREVKLIIHNNIINANVTLSICWLLTKGASIKISNFGSLVFRKYLFSSAIRQKGRYKKCTSLQKPGTA